MSERRRSTRRERADAVATSSVPLVSAPSGAGGLASGHGAVVAQHVAVDDAIEQLEQPVRDGKWARRGGGSSRRTGAALAGQTAKTMTSTVKACDCRRTRRERSSDETQ